MLMNNICTTCPNELKDKGIEQVNKDIQNFYDKIELRKFMKVKDITKPGYYKLNEETIFEVIKTEDRLIIDEWCFGYKYTEKTDIYQTSGGLFTIYLDYANGDVEPMKGYRFKIFGNKGAMLRVTKVNRK